MSTDPSTEPAPVDEGGSAVAVRPSPGAPALARDFVTFAVKILVNASIEFVMLPLASLAFASDMITRKSGKDARFYQVMRMGRRWDMWLRVFRPASQLKTEHTSLPKSAVTGADNLIASVEHLIRSGDLPSRYRTQVEQWGSMINTSASPTSHTEGALDPEDSQDDG